MKNPFREKVPLTNMNSPSRIRTENIFLVGSVPELGNWASDNAISLSSANYPTWSGKCSSSAPCAPQRGSTDVVPVDIQERSRCQLVRSSSTSTSRRTVTPSPGLRTPTGDGKRLLPGRLPSTMIEGELDRRYTLFLRHGLPQPRHVFSVLGLAACRGPSFTPTPCWKSRFFYLSPPRTSRGAPQINSVTYPPANRNPLFLNAE